MSVDSSPLDSNGAASSLAVLASYKRSTFELDAHQSETGEPCGRAGLLKSALVTGVSAWRTEARSALQTLS